MKFRALAAFLVLAASAAAHAAETSAAADINARLAAQMKRIDEARRTHQLTAFGYLSLLSEQQDITMDAHRAMADGVVTAEERRRIDIKLDRASAHIQRLTRKAAAAAEPK